MGVSHAGQGIWGSNSWACAHRSACAPTKSAGPMARPTSVSKGDDDDNEDFCSPRPYGQLPAGLSEVGPEEGPDGAVGRRRAYGWQSRHLGMVVHGRRVRWSDFGNFYDDQTLGQSLFAADA